MAKKTDEETLKLRKIFAKNLKFYRKKAKLTQTDLGTDIGVDWSIINRLENEKISPSAYVIAHCSEVFKIKPSKLFEDEL